MKETELKPCPFCGGEAKIQTVSIFHNSCTAGFGFVIQCRKCGVKYPETFTVGFELTEEGEVRQCKAYEGVIEQAKELWNRRADNEQRAD